MARLILSTSDDSRRSRGSRTSIHEPRGGWRARYRISIDVGARSFSKPGRSGWSTARAGRRPCQRSLICGRKTRAFSGSWRRTCSRVAYSRKRASGDDTCDWPRPRNAKSFAWLRLGSLCAADAARAAGAPRDVPQVASPLRRGRLTCCRSSKIRRSSAVNGKTRPSPFFVVPASRRTSPAFKSTCRHS